MARSADQTGRTMFQTERHREIVTLARRYGRVDVAKLADTFRVTTETIRRDLSDLQGQRLLRRVHGGAILWETSGFEPQLSVRSDQQVAEKRRIARLAVQELPDSGTIIIDSGSTLTPFAESIPKDRELQVVTNSLITAQALAKKESLNVVVLGGSVRKNTFAMVDPETVASVNDLAVDTLFISGDGMSVERGLTTPYRGEATLKQAMIASAVRVVALVDFSKMDKNHTIRFAQWGAIDVLITDDRASDEVVARLQALGPTVLRA